MAHEHEVIDATTDFILDDNLNITAVEVTALKRGDHKSHLNKFTMPRYFEGHDMSLCNKVEVHYNNIKTDKSTRETTTNSSFDEVKNFRVLEEGENKIAFEWLVQGDATDLDGTLNFCILFACMDGDIYEYKKFSGTYVGLSVDDSIYNTEEVERLYADVLAAWKIELEAKIANAGAVKTVNGVEPDENGNIEIEAGGGATAEQLAQINTNKENIDKLSEEIDNLSFELMITEVVNGIGKLVFVKKVETPTEGVTQVGSKLIILSGVTATQSGSTLSIA